MTIGSGTSSGDKGPVPSVRPRPTSSTIFEQRPFSLLLSCQSSQDLHLSLAIRPSIFIKHIVEPYGGGLEHIWPLPRVPRQIRLTPALYQSPIDCAHVVFPRERQNCIECASCAPSHVLGADQRAMEFLKLLDTVFESFRPVVIVEGDDI